MRSLFGYQPSPRWPRWLYNSVIGTIGCILVADTLGEMIGYVLILESILVSIEACWPASELPADEREG